MTRIAKFLRLAPTDRRLLIEASLLLLAARAALKLLPFETIARIVSRPPAPTRLDAAAADALARGVAKAVRVGARNGPGLAVCFPQGIAAQLMLARRGIASRLHYGVAKKPDGALEAHVWVRAGELPIVGCGPARRFTLLVSFPRETDTLAPTAPVAR